MHIDWDFVCMFITGWSLATVVRRWIGNRYNIEWMKL